jgi:hypothetical protein
MRRQTTTDEGQHGALMLALTDAELAELQNAAALLPQRTRDTFLRCVANRLREGDCGNLTDVIAFVLSTFGISAPASSRTFFCDRAPPPRKP